MTYSSRQVAVKYINYYFRASNGKGHGIHSPFVFHFIKSILNDRKPYSEYEKPEGLRQLLLKDDSIIPIEDLGAGSGITNFRNRSVSTIARHAAKSKKYAQLIFRIIRNYQPKTIIELGTSLGITTSYLSLANPGAAIVTIEGSAAVADIARQNFQNLGLTNIDSRKGNFDEVLPLALDELGTVDCCFIDGNHQYESTIRYFKWLLPKMHNDSILIFDDIHWSRGMENAWQEIQQHRAVRGTINLFFLGIVFFREEFKEKQHFRIRF